LFIAPAAEEAAVPAEDIAEAAPLTEEEASPAELPTREKASAALAAAPAAV
jgi:hypothetical protein